MNELKTVAEVAEVGVIIARFQSPFLHEGHIDILNRVTSNHPRVLVFLGLAHLKCTMRNPLDFAARKAMLEEKYPDVETYYIEDVFDDDIWSKNLDRQISKLIGPSNKVVLYGSRSSFIDSYKGKFPTVELVPNKFISASEIRKRIGIKGLPTEDWRKGVVHAMENQYPSFKPTVDMAIINFDTDEILLGQKSGETLLRFPGGFMDPLKDTSAETAAVRETLEETSLLVGVETYIGSMVVDDVRYRNEIDKIMTFLYAMRYFTGTPVAADDLSFVQWKNINDLKDTDINPTHRPIFGMFKNWFNHYKG
jgi:bifunctional NMN adenylyltransferase/nudix hydrolase